MTGKRHHDDKPPTPTPSSRRVSVLGIGAHLVQQEFADSVDWSFSDAHHNVLVWRHGQAMSKDVDFEGGRAGRVMPRADNVWVIPAGQRSAAWATKTECSFVHLTFPAAVIGHATLRPTVGEQDPLLRYMVERIFSVEGRDDVAARLLRETLADGLRLHVRDRYGLSPPSSPRVSRELSLSEQKQLVEFIRDGLNSEIDLVALAGLVEMKLNAFRDAFGRAFHATPHQFVLDQRIARAKLLLESAPMSVTEISTAVGFCTPSHFSTTFKQRVGLTPSSYREVMGRHEHFT